MAVAFRSQTTYNSGASSVSSFVINTPSGIQQNDIMFVFITFTGGSNITFTPPAGWIRPNFGNSTTVYGVVAYRKMATASEPASFTFGLSGTANVAAVMGLFSGAQVSNPQTTGSPFFSTGTTTGTSGNMLAGGSPAFFVKMVGSYRAATGGTTVSNPGSGYTTYADTTNSGAASNFVQAAMIGGFTNTDIGILTPQAVTLSNSMDSNAAMYFTFREDKTAITVPAIDYNDLGGTVGATSFSISHQQSTPNEMAYALITLPGSSNSVSSITGTGLNWSRVATSSNASNITVEVWKTMLSEAVATFISSTVNLTSSGAANCQIVTFAHAHIANGAVATANGATGVATSTLTTIGKNSWVYGFIAYTGTNTATAGTGNERILTGNTTSGSPNIIRQLSATANSGTSVTNSTTAPTTVPWAMIQFEVLSAIRDGSFLQAL